MFCPQCRAQLREDTRFCITCGCDIIEYKTPTDAAPRPASPPASSSESDGRDWPEKNREA